MRHTTIYRYQRSVRLGEHRLMLRPRDSHDLRLIETSLNFSPPASIRWIHDVFGNSVAIASFAAPTTELRIESNLRLERFALKRPAFQIAPQAVSYPFIYSADDRIDLGRLLDRQYPDPADRVGLWARGFVRSNPTDTLALLADLNTGVAAYISYQSRETEGTQTPVETLDAATDRVVISRCYSLRQPVVWASEPVSYPGISIILQTPQRARARPMHGPTSTSRAQAGSRTTRRTARSIAVT